jgi:hypothetical protein
VVTQQRVDKPTPNGGAYSIMYFKDAAGNPVDKESAVAAEAIEYTAGGVMVWRTYLKVAPRPR